MRKSIVLAIATVVVAGWLFAADGFQAPRSSRVGGAPPAGTDIRTVFYATDRLATGAQTASGVYGSAPAKSLNLGTCEVSIPRPPAHVVGRLEGPGLLTRAWRLLPWTAASDPNTEIILYAVDFHDEDEFSARLKTKTARPGEQEVLLFVHGYYVTFEDACRHSAQLAHDLGFRGAAALYSWPSAGGLLDYFQDEKSADGSIEVFTRFVKDLKRTLGARSLNLVAHSMGSRILAKALARLVPAGVLFDEVIFFAPDVPTQEFKSLVQEVQKTSRRVTLYVSAADGALLFAKKVDGHARAGEAGSSLVLLKDLDTIDATLVDFTPWGHSYGTGSRPVITDVGDVLQGRLAADRSTNLKPEVWDNGSYWTLKP